MDHHHVYGSMCAQSAHPHDKTFDGPNVPKFKNHINWSVIGVWGGVTGVEPLVYSVWLTNFFLEGREGGVVLSSMINLCKMENDVWVTQG